MSSTAIAASSVAISSIAASNARKARVESCKTTVAKFDSEHATVDEMQNYSQCVQLLYPQEGIELTKQHAQVGICVSIVFILIGVLIARRNTYMRDFEGSAIGGLIGLLIGWVFLAIAGFIYWAFR